MKTFLKGKGKINHLMDNPSSPKDPKFTLYDEEDSIIMSWLWNSMMLEVCGPYMFLTTIKDIWEVMRQTYSKVKDVALIYEIKIKLSMNKQVYDDVCKPKFLERNPSLNEVFSLIRVEKERRIVMLDVPNTKGCTMMITNSKNPSDAMNIAKMVKTKGKKIL
ncbi:hypothetical protein POTOM_035406 [Populus tomentosa]|uniref:Uncharacterized protein n=1 Tax=Populus tomentosa TaxID=118781 RepID=A0A8X7Z2L4_POPTO|nr:hypothetical protein POTOM_035406 [Populus tomentosa]